MKILQEKHKFSSTLKAIFCNKNFIKLKNKRTRESEKKLKKKQQPNFVEYKNKYEENEKHWS